MDRRTKRRHERLKLAAEVVARLNGAAAEYLAWQHEPAPVPPTTFKRASFGNDKTYSRALPDARYYPSDRVAWRLTQMAWAIRFNGAGKGYERPVLSTDRQDGKRVTVYFHGKSQSFHVKVAPGRPAPNAEPLVLDTLREIGSGVVARCGCLRFYVRHDERQRFCSTACANRVRQQWRRDLERKRKLFTDPDALEAARRAYEEAEERKATRRARGKILEGLITADQERRAEALDKRARKEQARFRFRVG